MITIQLSEDDADLLSSALWDYRNEGPPGEDWASDEIEELRAKIDEMIKAAKQCP